MKRKEILSQHPFKIWQDKSGKWHTYLPISGNGRVKKQGKDLKTIEDIIIAYYESAQEIISLHDVFEEWIFKKLEYKEIQKTSADRYKLEFERFFSGTPLYDKDIRKITEDNLEDLIRSSVAKFELTAKTYSNFLIILRGVFKYAYKKKYTTISISLFLDGLDIPKSAFKKRIINPKDEVFVDTELPVIKDYLLSHPTIWNLGILLSFQTGLRVGELSALKEEDWDSDRHCLHVRRTEYRYKDEFGVNTWHVKDFPKTEAGVRTVWLSDSAEQTLNLIVNESPCNEFMFENKDGKRIRGTTFNRMLDEVLKKLGLHHRSMHKIRKTYGSMLIDNNVDQSLVQEQMGHSSITTTKQYYYFNIRSDDKKHQQIQNALMI